MGGGEPNADRGAAGTARDQSDADPGVAAAPGRHAAADEGPSGSGKRAPTIRLPDKDVLAAFGLKNAERASMTSVGTLINYRRGKLRRKMSRRLMYGFWDDGQKRRVNLPEITEEAGWTEKQLTNEDAAIHGPCGAAGHASSWGRHLAKNPGQTREGLRHLPGVRGKAEAGLGVLEVADRGRAQVRARRPGQ